MTTSEYRVRVHPSERDLLEQIERLREDLELSRAETAHVIGRLAKEEERSKRLETRCGDLTAKCYRLEEELSGEHEEDEPYVVNALVTTRRPPLVVDLGRGHYAWIQDGRGFTLSTDSGRWVPLVDAEGLGGQVLKAAQVGELTLRFGRPL